MKQQLNLFNYQRGDQIKAADVNDVIFDAYNKINFLVHENMNTISTGQFVGDSLYPLMTFPNYCGKMESRSTVATYYDTALAKSYLSADAVLRIIGG